MWTNDKFLLGSKFYCFPVHFLQSQFLFVVILPPPIQMKSWKINILCDSAPYLERFVQKLVLIWGFLGMALEKVG